MKNNEPNNKNIKNDNPFEIARFLCAMVICLVSFFMIAMYDGQILLKTIYEQGFDLTQTVVFIIFGELNAIYTLLYIKKMKKVSTLKDLFISLLIFLTLIITFTIIGIIIMQKVK